jgi:HK97 family phage portal protein
MRLWERMFGKIQAANLPLERAVEKRSSTWDLLSGRGGFETGAGVAVSPYVAENLSAAFAAVQLVAQTMASLSPPYIYKRDASGARAEAPQHPVARLFAGDVNEHQTVADFFELMQAHVLWHGNAYAEIVRDQAGRPIELIPHHPSLVSVFRLPGRGRRLRYDVSDLDGGTRRLLADEMLHLRDRSDDGLVGKSRLQRAREAFGNAIATERFASATYRNGATLSGVLMHPDQLDEPASERLRKSFEEIHKGADNAGKVAVLEEGLKWQQTSVSPEDAQMLESRRFSVEAVCRMFGVPPQLVGDTSKVAYSNMIEAGRHFARFCLAPWCSKWEQTIASSLFSETDRATHEVEINLDELLRGDPLQRAQTWRVYRELGVVNANEIRAEEGWNPRTDPDAETYFAPLNLQSEQTGAPKDVGAANA